MPKNQDHSNLDIENKIIIKRYQANFPAHTAGKGGWQRIDIEKIDGYTSHVLNYGNSLSGHRVLGGVLYTDTYVNVGYYDINTVSLSDETVLIVMYIKNN